MATAVLNSEMRLALAPEQQEARERFRRFVQERISQFSRQWDQQECVPSDVIDELRSRGYLGAPLRWSENGPIDAITYGLLTEEIARGCSSVRSLLTVHDMVALGICRWGSHELKAEFADSVADGRLLCALALSEPDVGSDAASVHTQARADGNEYVVNGTKKWITFGQIADLFLVLARCEDRLTAFLVPAKNRGVDRRPIRGMMGTRASMLAQIEFRDCRIPKRYMVGQMGFGLSHVISTVLDHGRYSVAWGSVGIAQACLDASMEYATRRKQFGRELQEYQLIQRKLTDMLVNTRAARLLCYRAGYLRNLRDPDASAETVVAKYYASRTAVRNANDAVHLHGANGLSDEYPVARYLRDAKVTEVIEGSTEIHQISIARFALSEL